MRTYVHSLWRLFPAQLRQQFYERATCLLAPGVTLSSDFPLASLSEPFIVAGPLSAPTGLGESARLLLHGLMALGMDVRYVDLGPAMMQRPVVSLPTLPPAELGRGTLILAVQPPSVGHALLLLGRSFLQGKHRVGYWMWELETIPPSWRNSRRLVHEVAAPSVFSAKALARGLGMPVRHLILPLPITPRKQWNFDPRQPFTFGVGFDLGSTEARKNPFGAVQAFKAAFNASDPVRLLLKIRGEQADPDTFETLAALTRSPGPKIELVAGDLDQTELAAWWNEIDVLVSLHRSEGFGLFPAEAILQGIPVIATDWSATAEFVTSLAGWPIPARLIEVIDKTKRYSLPGAVWAEPDIAAAAAAMRTASRETRQELSERGQLAATALSEQFSLAVFRRQLETPIINQAIDSLG